MRDVWKMLSSLYFSLQWKQHNSIGNVTALALETGVHERTKLSLRWPHISPQQHQSPAHSFAHSYVVSVRSGWCIQGHLDNRRL